MHVQGFRDVHCEDAVVISKSVNDRGDYILEIKLAKEVVDTIKLSKPDKDGSTVSIEDSVFQTILGNLICYYLRSKTNLLKLAQTISILHEIVGDVCSTKLNEAIGAWKKQEEEGKDE